jgi:hypothetical protein
VWDVLMRREFGDMLIMRRMIPTDARPHMEWTFCLLFDLKLEWNAFSPSISVYPLPCGKKTNFYSYTASTLLSSNLCSS